MIKIIDGLYCLLEFSDYFTGTSLDTAKWDYRTDEKHWSKQLASNIRLDNKLIIDVKKETINGYNYTGGGVISKNKFGYGYYEAYVKIPTGMGWHSAFWLMEHNGNGNTGGELAELELDIFENDSISQNSFYSTLHDYTTNLFNIGGVTYSTVPDISENFVKVGALYTENVIKYYVNDQLVRTYNISNRTKGNVNIWCTSIASYLGGTPSVDDTQLPSTVEFKYVKYYRLSGFGSDLKTDLVGNEVINLPTTIYNGNSSFTTVSEIVKKSNPNSIYSGTLTQQGLNNPILNVVQNTTDFIIKCNRISQGIYSITEIDNLPIFTEKIIILSNNSNKFCKLIHFSLSEIRLLSYELSVVGNTVVEILTDDIDSFSFKIEILKNN